MGKYEPVIHTGTRDQQIRGLLREWEDVSDLRLHAMDRERERIEGILAGFGVQVYVGSEEDEGWILGRDMTVPHGPKCSEENCFCNFPWKVWHEPGFDNGIEDVGCEMEVQDYDLVPVDEAQRMGIVTAGMTQCSYGGDGVWRVPVVVSSHKEWIGPPRKTFSSESG